MSDTVEFSSTDTPLIIVAGTLPTLTKSTIAGAVAPHQFVGRSVTDIYVYLDITPPLNDVSYLDVCFGPTAVWLLQDLTRLHDNTQNISLSNTTFGVDREVYDTHLSFWIDYFDPFTVQDWVLWLFNWNEDGVTGTLNSWKVIYVFDDVAVPPVEPLNPVLHSIPANIGFGGGLRRNEKFTFRFPGEVIENAVSTIRYVPFNCTLGTIYMSGKFSGLPNVVSLYAIRNGQPIKIIDKQVVIPVGYNYFRFYYGDTKDISLNAGDLIYFMIDGVSIGGYEYCDDLSIQVTLQREE